MKSVGIMGTVGAAIAAAGIRDDRQMSRIFGAENIKRHLQRQKRYFDISGSIATGNRWGGPHLHKREIARRLRQQGGAAA